jgi:hypothetical protein
MRNIAIENDRQARLNLGKAITEFLGGMHASADKKLTFPDLTEASYLDLADFCLTTELGKTPVIPEALLQTLAEAGRRPVSLGDALPIEIERLYRVAELQSQQGYASTNPQDAEESKAAAEKEIRIFNNIVDRELNRKLRESGSTLRILRTDPHAKREAVDYYKNALRKQLLCLFRGSISKDSLENPSITKDRIADAYAFQVGILNLCFLLSKVMDVYSGTTQHTQKYNELYAAYLKDTEEMNKLSMSDSNYKLREKIADTINAMRMINREGIYFLKAQGLITKPGEKITFGKVFHDVEDYICELRTIFIAAAAEDKEADSTQLPKYTFSAAAKNFLRELKKDIPNNTWRILREAGGYLATIVIASAQDQQILQQCLQERGLLALTTVSTSSDNSSLKFTINTDIIEEIAGALEFLRLSRRERETTQVAAALLLPWMRNAVSARPMPSEVPLLEQRLEETISAFTPR